MDRYQLLMVIFFLSMIVVDWSNASNFRKLVATGDPVGTSNATQDSPLPTSLSNEKKPNLTPGEETKPNDTQIPNPLEVDSNGLNNTNNNTSSEDSNDKQLDKGKSEDVKEKVENSTQSKTYTSESCKGIQSCSDRDKTMIACIQNSENGTNQLTLLVQNEGDTTLKVNLTIAASTNYTKPTFEIPSHRTEKVNVTFSGEKNTKIILNAGDGDCELHIGTPTTTSTDNPSKHEGMDDPSKSEAIDDPSKSKAIDDPPKSDNPSKSKAIDDPPKSKSTDDPSKSKSIDDPSKSKAVDDPSKSKAIDDPSKSKTIDDPSNPKATEDPLESKGVNDPSKSEAIDDPSKSKAIDDPSKSKVIDKPSKSTMDTSSTPQSNLLKQLVFYSKQVTPIYGAYFAFLVAILIGGTWAFCSFRKKRSNNGVPYQELEMGSPESSNALNVETAESWDQDWDDDNWDEDKAITSPGFQNKNISSNGLTSRATKKDGWDADWDD